MKKKLFTLAFSIILLVSIVSIISAQVSNQGIGLANNNFTIVQSCNGSTYINITAIQFPDKTITMLNAEMEDLGGETYAYNFSDTEQKGSYQIFFISDGCTDLESVLEITPTGTELTTSQSIIYGFLLCLIGIFLFFAVTGIRKSNGSWLIFYICLTYVLLYVLMGVGYLVALNFLWATPIFESILYIVWFVMGIGFLPFVIVLSLYILGQEATAALEEDFVKQGYSREEARELSRKHKR